MAHQPPPKICIDLQHVLRSVFKGIALYGDEFLNLDPSEWVMFAKEEEQRKHKDYYEICIADINWFRSLDLYEFITEKAIPTGIFKEYDNYKWDARYSGGFGGYMTGHKEMVIPSYAGIYTSELRKLVVRGPVGDKYKRTKILNTEPTYTRIPIGLTMAYDLQKSTKPMITLILNIREDCIPIEIPSDTIDGSFYVDTTIFLEHPEVEFFIKDIKEHTKLNLITDKNMDMAKYYFGLKEYLFFQPTETSDTVHVKCKLILHTDKIICHEEGMACLNRSNWHK